MAPTQREKVLIYLRGGDMNNQDLSKLFALIYEIKKKLSRIKKYLKDNGKDNRNQ